MATPIFFAVPFGGRFVDFSFGTFGIVFAQRCVQMHAPHTHFDDRKHVVLPTAVPQPIFSFLSTLQPRSFAASGRTFFSFGVLVSTLNTSRTGPVQKMSAGLGGFFSFVRFGWRYRCMAEAALVTSGAFVV
jgi:hypothetical protein